MKKVSEFLKGLFTKNIHQNTCCVHCRSYGYINKYMR